MKQVKSNRTAPHLQQKHTIEPLLIQSSGVSPVMRYANNGADQTDLSLEDENRILKAQIDQLKNVIVSLVVVGQHSSTKNSMPTTPDVKNQKLTPKNKQESRNGVISLAKSETSMKRTFDTQ